MYQVDKRIHRHKKLQRLAIALLVLVVLATFVYWLFHLRITPKQDIRNSAPVSTNYNVQTVSKIQVEKPELHMELPSGWKEISYAPSPTAPKYGFKSESKDAQQIELYLDNPPLAMAVNKVIVVNAAGDGLGYDAVSDNCTTFTGPLKPGDTGNLPGKWQGMDFICDMGNYQRAVVGTISKDGVNQVNITGPTIGTHKFFIAYTDNNINPDYTVFYNILRSLNFK